MVTINDIARLAGVAKSTVSRYLNGGSVSAKTKAKIDKIVAETGYKPNTFAQSLKAKNTAMIGTIVPRLDSYATTQGLKGIDEQLRAVDYQLLITNSNQDIQREIEAIYAYAKQKVAGIILFATVITDEHRKAIDSSKVPVIILGQQAYGYHSIVHDDYQAGYMLGKYAVSLGHRIFTYFGVFEDDIAVGQKRKQGILDGIKPNGKIKIIETTFAIEAAYQKALQILPKMESSYVICATDNIALGVLKAAHELKMVIPDQFSLSGFGDYDVTTAVFPMITTIKFPYYQSGVIAAENLYQLIEGEKIPEIIKLDNQLVERESTKRLK